MLLGTNKKTGHNFSTLDMLFGDLPLSYWAAVDSTEVPWNLFREVKKSLEKDMKHNAIDTLNEIISLPGLESRQYLQAFHFLNGLQGFENGATKIFGVVLQVAMPQGLDVLAVYADYSARYYNYSGKSVIWEHPDVSIDGLIDDIFEKSKNVVSQIGPWKDARPQPPATKMARINFLTSNGLHFGEASQQTLFNDPMAGGLMYEMLTLMNTLIDKSMRTGNAGNPA